MAGDFYTLGSINTSELKVMAFPPRVSETIEEHKRRRKTVPQMVAVVMSVVIPFLLLTIFSDLMFIYPALYLAGTSIAVAYFVLFVVANKHFLERRFR